MIEQATINPIKVKILELGIGVTDWDNFDNLYNSNIENIYNLARKFELSDIDVIQDYHKKYIDFINSVYCIRFLSFFFEQLNELLHPLFEILIDPDDNEVVLSKQKDSNVQVSLPLVHTKNVEVVKSVEIGRTAKQVALFLKAIDDNHKDDFFKKSFANCTNKYDNFARHLKENYGLEVKGSTLEKEYCNISKNRFSENDKTACTELLRNFGFFDILVKERLSRS